MRHLKATLLAFSLALPVTAGAQPSAPAANDPAVDARARSLFLEGRDAFSRGDFATAARAFSQSYELSRRPQLLYNIGTSYERLHNWNEALGAFRRYVELVPDAADLAEVQSRIRVIEVEVQHQVAPPPPQVETTTRVVVVERPVVVPPDPPRTWRTVFWITGGLALISGGATLAVGLLANSHYNNLVADCGARGGCPETVIEELENRVAIVNGGIVLTSVLAAAAVTAFILDVTRPQRRPTFHQVPTARAGFAPVVGGGVFTFEGSL
jgi:tetratricopeptide (TPR) repeat protein